jgi:hypothetical protein
LASTLSFATNHEQVKGISTRGGKSTRDPPYSKEKQSTPVLVQVEEEEKNDVEEEVTPQEQELNQDFHDTTLLPFSHRKRKAKMDEQFGKFVEVIQKLYINILLLDAMQVSTYANYIRGILNNKRPLPTTEVIKLTEKCSAAILNKLPEKKKDPGCPTIDAQLETNISVMHSVTLE